MATMCNTINSDIDYVWSRNRGSTSITPEAGLESNFQGFQKYFFRKIFSIHNNRRAQRHEEPDPAVVISSYLLSNMLSSSIILHSLKNNFKLTFNEPGSLK